MNIVVSGNKAQVYGDGIQTYPKLPPQTYEVEFSKMSGFYLTIRNDLRIGEDKIYGDHDAKVNKILNSFKRSTRNFGVILSGEKGIGKSILVRMLGTKCVEEDMPVIIVPTYYPGIASFISSIEQEVLVVFDEFEKTFGANDETDPQEEMLPLFDGMDNGKKLFVITCNDVDSLNDFLLNRPGRFHYHFILNCPSSDEVKKYMEDKLEEKYHDQIERITSVTQFSELTYDCLRAIAFEINQGYSLEETFRDLNITHSNDVQYKVISITATGEVYTGYEYIDMYRDRKTRIRLWGDGNEDYVDISFYPKSIKKENDKFYLIPSDVTYGKENTVQFQSIVFEKFKSDYCSHYAV